MTRDHLTITYNGELYNYRQLRDQLQATNRGRFAFTSGTDTEVVLRAWQVWGPQALDRFVGMYAFALWDGRACQLHLVRDRIGIKPLYLHHGTRGLAFASEAEALLHMPGLDTSPDMDAVADHLLHSSTLEIDPTRTLIRGIAALPPATRFTFRPDGHATTHTYWGLPFSERSEQAGTVPDEGNSDAAAGHADAAEFTDLLRDSTHGMLTAADVPVAVLLSGGLDSATLTALAAADSAQHTIGRSGGRRGISNASVHGGVGRRDAPVLAVTLAHAGLDGRTPRDGDDPDLRHSRLLATHLARLGRPIRHRIKAHPAAVTLDDIDAVIDVASLADDPRHLASLAAYRHVRDQDRRVVLIGQGADEIMGGYTELVTFRRFILDVHRPDPTTIAGLPASRQTSHLTREVLARRSLAHQRILAHHDELPGDALERAHRLLFCTQLRRIVQFEDFLSMRASVEARLPYLDHRIVEYCFARPFTRHLHPASGRGKRLLHLAARDLLPPALLTRPKAVFPHPDHVLLHHELNRLARAHEADLRGDPLIRHLFALPAMVQLNTLPTATLWLLLTTWRWHHRLRHPRPRTSGPHAARMPC
jgi:asparagine synthase (glutamine-hydrolysing)